MNPMTELDFEISMPRLTADDELMGGPGLVAADGTDIENVSKIPKVDLGIPLSFGGSWGRLKLNPSAMYLKQEFANVATGDDTITSYGLSFGASLEFLNGLKLMAEYNYGQNLYNSTRPGESTCYPFKYELITGGLRGAMGARAYDGKIYDSTTNAGWIQLGYNIAGKAEPTIFYGRNNTKRDMPTALGYGDTDFTTQMYGINCPIPITENLMVLPEYMIYDDGDSNQINGITYDFGQEWMAGLEFQLSF